MKSKSANRTVLLDIGLVALFIAMLAVLVNQRALAPAAYTALLVGTMLAATVLGWWREARREARLDELELAAASFGARWSFAVLGLIALVFLFVPPVQDAIVAFASAYEDHETRPLPAPVGVFIVGFVLAMMVHLIAKSALGAAWKWTKR